MFSMSYSLQFPWPVLVILSQHKLKNEPISFVMFASLEVLTLVLLKTQKSFGMLHHVNWKIVG